MLTRAHRQEALSRAYIHAVAGRCGLLCSFRDYDYGIDLSLHEIRRKGNRYAESGFRLDIQAKSTTQAELTTREVLYDLEIRTYNTLRETPVGCRRILVVLLLPEDEATWTDQTEGHLLLRNCAYWVSLKGQPATANTKTIRVAIARENVFSVDALARLMDKVRKQEEI